MSAPQHPQTGLVEGIQKVAQGEPLSNPEMEKGIEKAIENLTIQQQQQQLGPHTQRVIEDIKSLLGDTRMALLEKNSDEKIQRLVRLIQRESDLIAREARKASTQVQATAPRAEDVKEQAKQALGPLGSVLRELVMSGDFRTFILDFLSFLTDSFSAGVKQEKEKYGLGEESLRRPTGEAKSGEEVKRDVKQQGPEIAKAIGRDIKEGNLPVDQQRKEELKSRFRQILSQLSNNPTYQESVRSLWSLYDRLRVPAEKAKEQVQARTDKVTSDYTYQELVEEAKEVLGAFAGGRQFVDRFANDFWTLMNNMRNDTELNNYFQELKSLITDVMNEPTYIDSDKFSDRFNNLWDRGNNLMDKWRNRDEMNAAIDDSNKLVDNIKNDPIVQSFSQDTSQLARDFFTDESGKPSFYVTREVVTELRDVLVPIFVQSLTSIPIPTIEGESENYIYKLSGFVFAATDIVPENMIVKTKTSLKLNADKKEVNPQDKSKSYMTVKLQNIKTHLRDVHFYYKHTTFPKISDEGLADLDVEGAATGITIKFAVVSPKDKPVEVRVEKVKANISGLKIKILDARHKIMDRIITSLFSGAIALRVQMIIQDNIKMSIEKGLENINSALTRLWQEQKRVSYGGKTSYSTSSTSTSTSGFGTTRFEPSKQSSTVRTESYLPSQ